MCYPLINEIFSGKDSVLQGTETKDSDKITAESLETMDQKNQTIEHANVEKEAEFGQASVELKPITKVCLVLLYYKHSPLMIVLLQSKQAVQRKVTKTKQGQKVGFHIEL